MKLRETWQANRGFVLFIFLMFAFRSTFADWNDVPSGSMRPTIIEGDRIFVNKMDYDIRVPFTNISLFRTGDPERGDVALFDSAVSDKRLVKRVIGVPGDVVQMQAGRLIINGEAVRYSHDESGSTEHLDSGDHAVQWREGQAWLTEFGPLEIPAERYLVLGDNRNNSADSRVIGLVPRDEFVGRSRHVVLSLDYDRYLLPRGDRFFITLDPHG